MNTDNLPPPKVLSPYGVVVPPRLQVNEMSISEWHNRTQWDANYAGLRTREALIIAAQKMGYSDEDIAREFGA